MKTDNTPYLMRGVKALTTDSSTLISSSVYLNEPRLRDWVATHFLRRSGRDLPTTSDSYKLHQLLVDVQDLDRIEELFSAERRRFPALDRWFSEGFVSTYTVDDLLKYPEGSLGHMFGRHLVDLNLEMDIVPRFEPKTQYEYYKLRHGQTHDLEHIVCGSGFDQLAELIPYFARLSNVPRFLSPELATEVNVGQLLGAIRMVMRTGLHYQQSFPTALKAMQCGMRVGEESGPMFLLKYEDAMHLPIAEARAALGVHGVVELDTLAASLEWDEYR